MPKANSSSPSKISKPYPEFPLTPHRASKQWCKKIRGKIYYFGPLDDPDAALKRFLAERDSLYAGMGRPAAPDAVRVKDVANELLNHRQTLVDAGELSPRTWDDYKAAADLVVREFGATAPADRLQPHDFARLRKAIDKHKWSGVRTRKFLQCIRTMFKHAYESGLLRQPVRFGPAFKGPSARSLRLERHARGPKMLEADEIRILLDAAEQPLKAMILLGVNCGFGNADVGRLPQSALDLETGWVRFPRPKTGIDRRCPLWPETIAAIREALESRPEPKSPEHAGLVFITKYGLPWYGDRKTPVSNAFAKVMKDVGIKRPGVNFYALRHVVETIGGEALDQIALGFIMGHADNSMAGVYRERISNERLRAVTDHVRKWLFEMEDSDNE